MAGAMITCHIKNIQFNHVTVNILIHQALFKKLNIPYIYQGALCFLLI